MVDAWQVLRGAAKVGASVVVADWRADWIGIGIAEKLAEEGCRVRLCVNGYTPGQTIQQPRPSSSTCATPPSAACTSSPSSGLLPYASGCANLPSTS